MQIKRTSISGRTPNTTNSSNTAYIDAGELAINLTDQKMFSSNGSVAFEIGSNVATLTVSSISANGSLGNPGQKLTSDGVNVYWSTAGGGGGEAGPTGTGGEGGGGGGGGSNYVTGTNTTTTVGGDGNASTSGGTTGGTVANSADADYNGTAGVGGASNATGGSAGNAGAPGLVIIKYSTTTTI